MRPARIRGAIFRQSSPDPELGVQDGECTPDTQGTPPGTPTHVPDWTRHSGLKSPNNSSLSKKCHESYFLYLKVFLSPFQVIFYKSLCILKSS